VLVTHSCVKSNQQQQYIYIYIYIYTIRSHSDSRGSDSALACRWTLRGCMSCSWNLYSRMPKLIVRCGHILVHCSSVDQALEVARRLDGSTSSRSTTLDTSTELEDYVEVLGGVTRYIACSCRLVQDTRKMMSKRSVNCMASSDVTGLPQSRTSGVFANIVPQLQCLSISIGVASQHS